MVLTNPLLGVDGMDLHQNARLTFRSREGGWPTLAVSKHENHHE
jgi:hypothetical protein